MREPFRTHAVLVSMAALVVMIPLLVNPPSGSDASPTAIDERLRFDTETILIFVEPDSLRIEGHYRFVVPTPGPGFQNLLYPYPADSLLGGARTVSLEWRHGEQSWQALDFRELGDGSGAIWPVPLPEEGKVEVRTVYRQKRLAAYGRYIVTTTRGWPQPLRHARFEIHLPPGAEPLAFSHPFVRDTSAGENRYLFVVNNFFPDRDILFSWRP